MHRHTAVDGDLYSHVITLWHRKKKKTKKKKKKKKKKNPRVGVLSVGARKHYVLTLTLEHGFTVVNVCENHRRL